MAFNKVENSDSVILAMGFKKNIIAPQMGVLKQSLSQQHEFLYKDGEFYEKLELAFHKSHLLNEYGNKNFQEPKKYSWNNFTKLF